LFFLGTITTIRDDVKKETFFFSYKGFFLLGFVCVVEDGVFEGVSDFFRELGYLL